MGYEVWAMGAGRAVFDFSCQRSAISGQLANWRAGSVRTMDFLNFGWGGLHPTGIAGNDFLSQMCAAFASQPRMQVR
jgi:hypothetical protein